VRRGRAAAPPHGPTVPRRLRLLLLRAARLAGRPGVGALLVVLAAVAGCVGTGRAAGIPAPVVHDEFSYLLAADTFAHGRMANPPLPLAEPFESFHILVRPTYASMYPPAQGLVLAGGQTLGGEPIHGVWGLCGLLGLAVLWALRAWVPGRWALLGALLVVARLGFGNYWAQSYWGGYPAALGGALVVGGLRRLLDDPRPRHGLLAGLGAVVLANSRPWEGLVLCVAGGALLVAGLVRLPRGRRRAAWLRGVLPMAAYDQAVTGSPWRLPYLEHARQYLRMPLFLWDEPRPAPAYRVPDLATFHGEIEPTFAARWADYPGEAVARLRTLGSFFLGRTLFAVALGVVLAWRRRRARALALWAVWALLGHMAASAFFPHYAAPMTVLVACLFAMGARAWSRVRVRGWRLGPVVVAVVLVALVSSAVDSAAEGVHEAVVRRAGMGGWRPDVIRRLEGLGPRHVVFVRYGPHHWAHREWVYNGADLAESRVLWARDLGDASNAAVRALYPGRTAWRLTVDWDGVAPALERLPP
jgi:hypothetical protein